MSCYRRFVVAAAVSVPLSLSFLFSCGNSGGSSPTATNQYGEIEIRARVVSRSLSKSAGQSGAAAATSPDSLVVEVSGSDAPTFRDAIGINPERPSILEKFFGVPLGKNRKIEIWAKAKDGTVTHIDTVADQRADIVADGAAAINTTLIPAIGSIYLQFIALPTNSSVYARFAADTGTFVVTDTVNRDTRTFVTLDDIPHNTEGYLTVIIYSAANATGDTLRIANQSVKFDARGDNQINMDFKTVGGDGKGGDDDKKDTGDDNGGTDSGNLGLDITVNLPGVTIASYHFGDDAEVQETGELFITEIMWNITYENYIELYNPQNDTLKFDTLIIETNASNAGVPIANMFFDVRFAPKSYRVFGRRSADHIDHLTQSESGLALGTPGNWITVKRTNGTIMDRVICASGTVGNAGRYDWPGMPSSARRSIQLHADKYNAFDNNFGKNWFATAAADSNLIAGTTNYGTPGR